ncbi:hypothetical protein LEP1GSC202_2630 [Leptospira yanagawae serovar Saopaulo str. Sao Paulo = ATCC 700523]|uniref:Uncharacterized protein n=1 Tax=Leptospira yanagawae serovar Saopaulo str. Sao Paulo = ATCC 700523 TaxID=1249483 RepID=A0A5E8HAI5_9LEPT|nr:hypothetical protein LEP1GSC202_2630 [Leptospira yanagawae serovar Saopaulo str. Sao Paulo = ATCC 700523]
MIDRLKTYAEFGYDFHEKSFPLFNHFDFHRFIHHTTFDTC